MSNEEPYLELIYYENMEEIDNFEKLEEARRRRRKKKAEDDLKKVKAAQRQNQLDQEKKHGPQVSQTRAGAHDDKKKGKVANKKRRGNEKKDVKDQMDEGCAGGVCTIGSAPVAPEKKNNGGVMVSDVKTGEPANANSQPNYIDTILDVLAESDNTTRKDILNRLQQIDDDQTLTLIQIIKEELDETLKEQFEILEDVEVLSRIKNK